jgi:hypothetical protein
VEHVWSMDSFSSNSPGPATKQTTRGAVASSTGPAPPPTASPDRRPSPPRAGCQQRGAIVPRPSRSRHLDTSSVPLPGASAGQRGVPSPTVGLAERRGYCKERGLTLDSLFREPERSLAHDGAALTRARRRSVRSSQAILARADPRGLGGGGRSDGCSRLGRRSLARGSARWR